MVFWVFPLITLAASGIDLFLNPGHDAALTNYAAAPPAFGLHATVSAPMKPLAFGIAPEASILTIAPASRPSSSSSSSSAAGSVSATYSSAATATTTTTTGPAPRSILAPFNGFNPFSFLEYAAEHRQAAAAAKAAKLHGSSAEGPGTTNGKLHLKDDDDLSVCLSKGAACLGDPQVSDADLHHRLHHLRGGGSSASITTTTTHNNNNNNKNAPPSSLRWIIQGIYCLAMVILVVASLILGGRASRGGGLDGWRFSRIANDSSSRNRQRGWIMIENGGGDAQQQQHQDSNVQQEEDIPIITESIYNLGNFSFITEPAMASVLDYPVEFLTNLIRRNDRMSLLKLAHNRHDTNRLEVVESMVLRLGAIVSQMYTLGEGHSMEQFENRMTQQCFRVFDTLTSRKAVLFIFQVLADYLILDVDNGSDETHQRAIRITWDAVQYYMTMDEPLRRMAHLLRAIPIMHAVAKEDRISWDSLTYIQHLVVDVHYTYPDQTLIGILMNAVVSWEEKKKGNTHYHPGAITKHVMGDVETLLSFVCIQLNTERQQVVSERRLQ